MPRFLPFSALRYASDIDLAAVTAPPYDVLSDDDVARYAATDARNIVHVDIPRPTPDGYQQSAALLHEWVDAGILVRDETPSFTIYRMTFTDESGAVRTTSGVLGGLGVYDYSEQQVLPHERITPKASTDRLDLTRATGTNLSPVWGLSLATGLTAALEAPAELLGSVTVDGVTHTVERVTDPQRIAEISSIVAQDNVLIADGHHRYGVAQQYLAERVAAGAAEGAGEALVYLNELVADQLSIAAIHRLYSGVSFEVLRQALSSFFEFEPGPEATGAVLSQLDDMGRLLLMSPTGETQWLIPRSGAFEGIRALDGAWLEHALGSTDVQVDYQHGVDEMNTALATGNFTAGVLIRPTSVTEIIRTAREGKLMPPKSTFFTPKLRTGLVAREIV